MLISERVRSVFRMDFTNEKSGISSVKHSQFPGVNIVNSEAAMQSLAEEQLSTKNRKMIT